MTLTYLFHSGFLLETASCMLIFDYWRDPAQIIPKALQKGKPIYVLASHFHEDHFTQQIFSWRETTPAPTITYLLSKDILRHRRATIDQADAWLAKGQTWQDPNIQVTAMGSNDSGVSWVVRVDGKTFFHAGDLNNWYARFLAERDAIPETIISEEYKEISPLKEEKRFIGELKDIAKVANHFDVAMFPVDGRIGNGYTLGGRQFIDRFHVNLFVPMHFVMSGFESSWRMEEFCLGKGCDFWRIEHEGQCREV